MKVVLSSSFPFTHFQLLRLKAALLGIRASKLEQRALAARRASIQADMARDRAWMLFKARGL